MQIIQKSSDLIYSKTENYKLWTDPQRYQMPVTLLFLRYDILIWSYLSYNNNIRNNV